MLGERRRTSKQLAIGREKQEKNMVTGVLRENYTSATLAFFILFLLFFHA
jgi:hypothetical protein